MTAHTGRSFRLEDLPKTIPLFPLTGALLLPGGRLPLNIFEPRYLAMAEDALAARDRIIGMIQPREPGAEGMTRAGVVPPPAPVYPTGCAGRLTSFTETEDGRYLIQLAGVCRFDIVDELPTLRGYRRAVANFERWRADLAPQADKGGVDRERLLRELRAYFAVRNISADWDAITDTPDDRLVTTLAMACPFAPQEKQALLECATLDERARTMVTLLEMATAGQDGESAKH
jgi:Lon protease-like protein